MTIVNKVVEIRFSSVTVQYSEKTTIAIRRPMNIPRYTILRQWNPKELQQADTKWTRIIQNLCHLYITVSFFNQKWYFSDSVLIGANHQILCSPFQSRCRLNIAYLFRAPYHLIHNSYQAAIIEEKTQEVCLLY